MTSFIGLGLYNNDMIGHKKTADFRVNCAFSTNFDHDFRCLEDFSEDDEFYNPSKRAKIFVAGVLQGTASRILQSSRC